MKDVILVVFVVVSLTFLMNSNSKEVMCSNKSFICYDETRFYQCNKKENGDRAIQGYLQSCPLGLVCNNLNEFECEEDISKEFLNEQKYYFKFGGREGRKRIIDD